MIPSIAHITGWWWPLDDIHARPVIERDVIPSITALLKHVRGRDCIVQAGANIGMYPVMLADHFQSVVTCEPDPTNWLCLSKNIVARDSLKRVTAIHAAFGEQEGGCTPVVVEPHNCGAHRVDFDKGTVPVWTIDGLELAACDCIWLDCEGSELFALRGAVETIDRHAPVICVEDKGLGAAFFGIEPGSLQRFLATQGYEEAARIGRDKVFRRST